MTAFGGDIERIRNATSLDEIRAVVREYPAKASGNRSALYSGLVGSVSANELATEHAKNGRVSIIDSTPRGRLLADEHVRTAIQNAAERIFRYQGELPDTALKLRDDFLYGDAKAPVNSPTSIQNCLWCEASRDFANSLRNDVKVIAVNANPYRVFGQVEIPTALQNPNVRSVGGVPVETLRATYTQYGVEGVLPQVQAAYIREATLAGLLPAAATELPAGVRRATGTTLRVAAKGLGVAGAAATIYDGVATTRHAVQLHRQGNDTGAQSHIVGAVSRSVGGLGGVTLGASAGATLTAETGPGAFVGGAVGGVVGAVAGDRLAAWIDHERIYKQRDGEGHRWNFDPEHPAQGWTRTVTGDLDTQATVDRGIPIYTQRTLTAPPELADRLNYQASSRAVELAMAAPPEAQDPYMLPSAPQDHRAGHIYEGNWQRDAGSEQWSRQVTDSHVGLSMQRFQTEVATPAQAAALERESQAIMARNLAAAPPAQAAVYAAAYEQFGWSRHGDMPDAVRKAIQPAERTVTADNPVHERGGNGRPPAQSEGDTVVARYVAALEAGDEKGALAIAHAYATSDDARRVQAEATQSLVDEQRLLPGRDQPMFVQAMAHLEQLGPEKARYEDQADMERMAGMLAFEARRSGMKRIDSIEVNRDDHLTATQDMGNRWFKPSATIDPLHASLQPLDRSLQGLASETELQAQQALQRELEQSQQQSMGRSL